MPVLARLASLWRNLVHRSRVDRDLDDEVTSALHLMIDEKSRDGLDPAAARRAALVELGRVESVTERVRAVRAGALLTSIVQDVRFAFRLLRRSPAFTAIAVASLGLGIGANTAIFSLVDAVLLKTLPVAESSRLFFVDNSGGKSGGSNAPPYPCYETLRDKNRYFSGMAAFDQNRTKVTIDGAESEVSSAVVSGSYHTVLGLTPAYGRLLTTADDNGAADDSGDGIPVVISYGMWQRRFGLSPSVLGKNISLGTRRATIVGVTRPGFNGLVVGSRVDVTMPITRMGINLKERQSWWFSVVGRLADGAEVEAARADLDGMFQAYMAEIGMQGEARRYFDRIALVPAARGLGEQLEAFTRPLMIVMAIVGLVLLVGCANVANLLLARASARRAEIAVRLSIGASRGRLVRQMLTESAVLVLLGTGVALWFGQWGASLLARFVAGAGERLVLEPALDWRVLGFTTLVAAITGLLFGSVPAWQAVQLGPVAGGRATASTSALRGGRALVALQVALSLVLVCGAALFVRTLQNLYRLDPGFDRGAILLARVDGSLPRMPDGPVDLPLLRAEQARIFAIWDQLLTSVAALPGVQVAGASTLTPMLARDRGVRIAVVGAEPIPETDSNIHLNQVTPGYFAAIGIRLVSGRFFEAADGPSAHRVAILNETAARFYFKNGSPLGRSINVGGRRGPDDYEVVGIVADARYKSLRRPDERMVYLPLSQPRDRIGGMTLAIRGSGDVAALVPAIRDQARQIVPSGFVSSAQTMSDKVDESLTNERMVSLLATFFGGLALVMACIGLYGVTAYASLRRTREIGIRIAIGAARSSVVWLVLRETATMVALGVAVGIPIMLLLARSLENQLFGVSSSDSAALLTGLVTLLAVAAAAAYVPARRASRVDPMVALRGE